MISSTIPVPYRGDSLRWFFAVWGSLALGVFPSGADAQSNVQYTTKSFYFLPDVTDLFTLTDPRLVYSTMLAGDAVWKINTGPLTNRYYIVGATLENIGLTYSDANAQLEAELVGQTARVNLSGGTSLLKISPPIPVGARRVVSATFTMTQPISLSSGEAFELRLKSKNGAVSLGSDGQSDSPKLDMVLRVPQWKIEDFEGTRSGAEVLLRPAHSSIWSNDSVVALSGLARVTRDEANDLLDPDIGTSGLQSYFTQWLWKETAPNRAVAVLESAGATTNAAPLIDFTYGFSLNVLYEEGPKLGILLLAYDSYNGGEVGMPGPVTGPIEAIGAVDIGQFPPVPSVTIEAKPYWQYVYFDIPNITKANFSGGNGVLNNQLGSFAGLGFVRMVTSQVAVRLYLDDVYAGERQHPLVPPTPTPTLTPTLTATPTPPLTQITLTGDYTARPIARVHAFDVEISQGGDFGHRIFVAGATEITRIDHEWNIYHFASGVNLGISLQGEIAFDSDTDPSTIIHLDRIVEGADPFDVLSIDNSKNEKPDRLIKIDRYGQATVLSATAGYHIGPFGIAVPPTGSDWPAGIYVADASSAEPGIKKVNADGTLSLVVPASRFPGAPQSIAFGIDEPFGTDLFVGIAGDDDLFVVDFQGRVRRFALDIVGMPIPAHHAPIGDMVQTLGGDLGDYLYITRNDGEPDLYRISPYGRVEWVGSFGNLPLGGLAYDPSGYFGDRVYVALGEWLYAITNGEEPTATPTATHTPSHTSEPQETFTPTITSTPPEVSNTPTITTIPTPTPSPSAPPQSQTSTPTVMPTSLSTATSTPTATSSPTVTGSEATATPTQITIEPLRRLAYFELDNKLNEEGFLIFPGGLEGLYTSALLIDAATIPGSNGFEGDTNGKGLLVAAGPQQVITILKNPDQPVAGVGTFLLSVSVRATGPGASVYLVGVDPRLNGSLAYAAPNDSEAFVDRWRRISVVFDARGGGILPGLQVANETSNQTVIVYFDRLEIYAIDDDRFVPGNLIGDPD